MSSTPRRLTDADSRQVARRTLDMHWDFVRRLARQGIIHFCVWNKYHHKEQRNEARHGLIDGLEVLGFVRQHRSWFGSGAYDLKRNTRPMWLTARGRRALRRQADRPEMIFGGLVEPGYKAMPLDFHRDLNEQRSRVRCSRGLLPATYIRPLTEKIEEQVDRKPARKRKKAR